MCKDYNVQAIEFANKVGLTMKIGKPRYGKHFVNDMTERYIFPITLKRGDEIYKFKFGQSIKEGSNEPNLYTVLSCLQKYDVGSFDDFCGEFGYECYTRRDVKNAEKIYNAVCKEFEAVDRLFSDVMDELCEIN